MNIKQVMTILLMPISALTFAQECNDQTLNEKTVDQYVDSKNGVIIDKATALMWQSCTVGQVYQNDQCTGEALKLNWLEAFEQAKLSELLGYTAWRLPNIKELASLETLNCYGPAIDISLFPNTLYSEAQDFYWSSTKHANIDWIWTLKYEKGETITQDKTNEYYVRLVRDL